MSVKTPQAIKRITSSKEYKKADYKENLKVVTLHEKKKWKIELKILKEMVVWLVEETLENEQLEELGRVDAEEDLLKKVKEILETRKKRIVRGA